MIKGEHQTITPITTNGMDGGETSNNCSSSPQNGIDRSENLKVNLKPIKRNKKDERKIEDGQNNKIKKRVNALINNVINFFPYDNNFSLWAPALLLENPSPFEGHL